MPPGLFLKARGLVVRSVDAQCLHSRGGESKNVKRGVRKGLCDIAESVVDVHFFCSSKGVPSPRGMLPLPLV